MKFLLFILLCSNLFAFEHNFSGKAVFYSAVCKSKVKNSVNLESIQINNDFNFGDDYYIESAISAYNYNYKNYKILNNAIGQTYKTSDINIRSLYISKRNGNNSFGIGIIPLSQASYSKTSSDFVKEGDGLTILHDIDLFGVFVKHYYNNNSIALVISQDFKDVPNNMYTNNHYRNNSYIFLINEINKDKFGIINEFDYVKERYDNKEKGDLFMYGLGNDYDDTDYSGIYLYYSLGLSYYKNKSSLDKNNYYGAAITVGARKDFDLFNRNLFLHFEYFKPFKDWYSLNNGSMIENNYNSIFSISDYSYISTLGIDINKDLSISADYSNSKVLNFLYDDAKMKRTSENKRGYNINIYKIKLTYKF